MNEEEDDGILKYSKQVKAVETDAGRVEFQLGKDAVAMAEYDDRKKAKRKSAFQRLGIMRLRESNDN